MTSIRTVAQGLACASVVRLLSVAAETTQRPSYSDWQKSQEGVAEEAAAVKARHSKMAAVEKVIDLLEGLQSKVTQEGESEAQTYNKFSCFCKDTTAEKTKDIQSVEDNKGELTASIEERSRARDDLDTHIGTLNDEITDAENAMKIAAAERAGTLKTYETNAEDLKAAIAALNGAIGSLKTSKAPALVQIQSMAGTLRTAALLADALGLESAHKVAAFLQANPDVPMQDYDFHSDGIIETLEKLLKDFRSEKASLDADEVSSVQKHNSFMQEKTDFLKRKNSDLETAKKHKAMKQQEIASASAELTTVAATLLDDKQYLAELASMCSDKAKTWDQRSQIRSDELSALTSAIGIIKASVKEKTSAATMRLVQRGVSVKMADAMARNPVEMQELEAEAEAVEAAPSFLQRVSDARFLAPVHSRAVANDGGRGQIAALLRTKGQQLSSALLTSLANQAATDPLGKVKVLIQELIERLLAEESKDANQHEWCDKAQADAKQKRDHAAGAVEELNGEMASLEATRDKLAEELQVVLREIGELEQSRADAVSFRANETAENAATTSEAQEGLEAVLSAIRVLSEFYKTVAKEEVKLSLAQRGPAEDAPSAGFDNGEAYKGSQGEAGGIIGMMEVIQSDFERTISETAKEEAKAVQAHLEFMTETGKSLEAKKVANAEQLKQKDTAEEQLEAASDSLQSNTGTLSTAISELMELKPVCVTTVMTYDERVSRREDEIQSLKKGLCILEHYAEYGPDGSADAC
eukprot:TRINITY_DN2685_c0_g3_i1.p1 TRINITY_DN2685_c0_g3~~TRINITY_DN2685_c0_g3_i1.p1  ORF type:complete len:755 (-),score=204.24 TRINITY_DN2685_c0_g3_i1:65-2329(-)